MKSLPKWKEIENGRNGREGDEKGKGERKRRKESCGRSVIDKQGELGCRKPVLGPGRSMLSSTSTPDSMFAPGCSV